MHIILLITNDKTSQTVQTALELILSEYTWDRDWENIESLNENSLLLLLVLRHTYCYYRHSYEHEKNSDREIRTASKRAESHFVSVSD